MSVKTEQQKIRYEYRNEIENIIKKYNIDRKSFHEVDKFYYKKVQHHIYYTFCNYQKYPDIQFAYMWTRLRDNLKTSKLIRTDWSDWNAYIDKINPFIPDKNPSTQYYLIMDGGWVYEGTITEIKKVLYEMPVFMEDFYLSPKDYSWLIIHCEDGVCMFQVFK